MKLGLKIKQSKDGKGKTKGENDKSWRSWLKRSRLVKFLPFLLLAFVIWLQQTLQYEVVRPIYIPISTEQVGLELGTRKKLPTQLEVLVKDKGIEHLRYGWEGFAPLQLQTITEKNGSRYVGLLHSELDEAVKAMLSTTAEVVQMSLTEIKVAVYERVAKKLPIKLDGTLRTPNGYTGAIKLIPDSVLVYAEPSVANDLSYIKTVTWQDSTIKQSKEYSIALNLDDKLYSEVKSIKVRVQLEELTEKSYVLPIEVVNAPEEYTIRPLPSTANVQLTIPRSRFNQIKEEELQLTAEYSPQLDKVGELQLKLKKRPSFVVSARISPEVVQFIKEKKL